MFFSYIARINGRPTQNVLWVSMRLLPDFLEALGAVGGREDVEPVDDGAAADLVVAVLACIHVLQEDLPGQLVLPSDRAVDQHLPVVVRPVHATMEGLIHAP